MIKNNLYQLEVSPLTNVPDSEFRSFTITEFLGGSLPLCSLTMKHNGTVSVDSKIDEVSIHIKTEGANSTIINFKGIAYSIEFLSDEVVYSIMAIPRDFVKTPKVKNLGKSIDSAVRSLIKVKHNNQQSNANGFNINQCSYNDYNMLKILMQGYNTGIIYSINVDGLVINKIGGDSIPYDLSNISQSSDPRVISDNKYKGTNYENTQLHHFSSSKFERYISYASNESKTFMNNMFYNLKHNINNDISDSYNFNEYFSVPVGLYLNINTDISERKLLVYNKLVIFSNTVTSKVDLIKSDYDRGV